MGYRFEVEAYVQIDPDDVDQGYHYVQVYYGQSLLSTLRAARKARREGSGCVRVMWRG